MNIYDISQKAEVSPATVSRVINGSRNVREKTRTKVTSIITELGYTPNAFAQGLGHDTMRTMGILCVDPSDPKSRPGLLNAISYIQRELRTHDYDAVIYCVDYNMTEKARCINDLIRRRVDAIFIVGSLFIENKAKNNQCILDAAESTPIALINGYLNHENIYSFLCDDDGASRQAVGYLLDTNCKKILFLHGGMSDSEKRKLHGCRQAHASKGYTFSDDYVHACPQCLAEGAKFIENLAAGGLEFDAVFTTEDSLAVCALKYAQKNKINIPEDLCIMGYNNSVQSVCTSPELSSVDQNIEVVCATAVSMLIGRFKKGGAHTHNNRVKCYHARNNTCKIAGPVFL